MKGDSRKCLCKKLIRDRAGIAGIYNRSPYEREVRAALALWQDHVRTLVEGGERKVVPYAPHIAS